MSEDFSYGKYDSADDIKRKRNAAISRLQSEESQVGPHAHKRMPLYEAYLQNTIDVFGRDLAKLAQQRAA